MADNVIADSGDSGGATFATDDIGSVHFPLTKIVLGAMDANDGPVSSANQLPITGTVTANLSATDNAVLDSIDTAINGTLTVGSHAVTNAGTFAVQADSVDGIAAEGAALGNGILVQGDDGTDRTNVLVDTDGHLQVDVLSGGGGGTAYTEDVATPATQVGTATMMERDDALTTVTPVEGDWIGLRGTAEGALWTQDFNSDSMTSSLTTISGAVTIMDDWDESDRAKVNLIVGQAGIAAGAGAVAATVPRVTLASDDPGVSLLGAIDADTSSIKTAVELIDNAIAGTEMQVDVVAALPAGTNAIGKLAANSGVDIGDVDVTSLPGAIQGPANPTIDSYTQVALSEDVGANNVVIAAPGANKQIWVYGIVFVCDTAATSVTFQDEDDTAISGTMLFAQYGGLSHSPAGNFSMPLWKVPTNKALEVDLVTGDIDGWISYAIVSV